VVANIGSGVATPLGEVTALACEVTGRRLRHDLEGQPKFSTSRPRNSMCPLLRILVALNRAYFTKACSK